MRLGSARTRSSVAPALVLPYPALEKAGLRLRRGQTSLTVAAPGVGKTQLWANLAYRMQLPTLYWSADTDRADVTVRTLAVYTGLTAAEIETNLSDPTWRKWMFEKLGHRADHIEWLFDSPITGKMLGERMNAFASLHGQYPHLAVLDNLANAIQNPADEYAEIRMIQTQAQALAREANCHVAILHHAKGAYDDGSRPIPQSGGLQNPYKIPEVGLSMYKQGEDKLAVNIVKNRGGVSDPGAVNPIVLHTDFSRATVLGFTERERVAA